jgi:beta-lactamase class A
MSQVNAATPSQLERQIASLAAEFKGEIGVYARNLHTGEEASINADSRFPTASTIKTAVMIEAYHQAAEKRIKLDDVISLSDDIKVGGSGVLNRLAAGVAFRISDLIHLMIVLSDNTATNLLVTRLGTKSIDDRLASYGLQQTKIFRPTFRDGQADVFPELEKEFGLGMTTPREMGGLMALIAQGRVVNPQVSGEMFGILRHQQDRAMIPRLLPPDVIVGNKTGTDAEKLADKDGRRGAVRADAAIVNGPGVNYVLAIYARKGADTSGGIDNAALVTGARISRLVYDRFKTTAPARGEAAIPSDGARHRSQ